MQRSCRFAFAFFLAFGACAVATADWRQFRGPNGLGVSTEKALPTEWSADKNLVWKTKLPGFGGSTPVTVGNRIYVTCYSGYGLDTKAPGDQANLRRHLLCVELGSGKILWSKEFEAVLPEHKYAGEGAYHGYSSSTPTTDGERLYVFFGKSGVFCFDLDGKQLWHAAVGKGTNGWGSGASPLLYKDLLIINASVESKTIVALDRKTGNEVWRTKDIIIEAWNTPLLVTSPEKSLELVISVKNWLIAFDPDTGKELWRAEGVHRYVCPSVVAHDGVVYAIGGGHTSLAVKAGGRGDVTMTHTLWRTKKGSNVSSPIYHEGHLYWADAGGGVVHCQEAATGKFVYSERLKPAPRLIYGSPVLADGKIYYISQTEGTFVVAAQPKFELLARNVFADDTSRANSSIAVSNGQLLMRTDQYLYCIGKR
jgi:outer membrane protein assembly factor BamB